MEHTTTRYSVLLVVTISAFLTPFMSSALNIALPSLGREFAMDAIALSWVATAYSLAAAVFLLPSGRIADIHGRKRVFVAGTIIHTLASVLIARAQTASLLIAFRILQGTGAALLFATGTAILTSVFPAGERGRVLGVNISATYVGLAIGPLLGGLLTSKLSWRSIFWLGALLGIAIIMACWRLKVEWAEARGERFDLPGSIIYGISLVALMYGFARLPAVLGGVLVAAGIIGFVIFARWETRIASPLLNVALFRQSPVFALSNLAALISYTATSAISFLFSLYLQSIRTMTPLAAGRVLIAQPIMQATFSPLAGWLSDRIEPRVVASLGMALMVISLLLLAFIEATTPLWFIIMSLAWLGFGFALFSSPNVNAVMSCVGRRHYGVASATLATIRVIGQTLSMGLATLVFAVIMGHVQLTPEIRPLFVQSIKVILAVSAALCLGGTFASLARGRVSHQERPHIRATGQ